MALTIIQGTPYTIENGLSSQSSYWYVVGQVEIPIRVDQTLGWRNTSLNFEKPTFASCSALMCLPSDPLGNILSNECSFVPLFGITGIVSTGDANVPVVVTGPSYDSDYEISQESGTWYIQEINSQPVRIDDTLSWRVPGPTETPTFITSDSAIAFPTSGPPWVLTDNSVSLVPLFLATSVLSWQSITGSSGGGGGGFGPMGPQGFQGPVGSGIVGPQGFQGLSGPQGFQGISGPQGFQGMKGPTGSSLISAVEVNLPSWNGTFGAYHGVTYNASDVLFSLPFASSPSDDGKTLTVTDETGTVSSISQGIYVSSPLGQTINGQSQLIMKLNYMSVTFIFRNNSWFVYSTYSPAVWSPFTLPT